MIRTISIIALLLTLLSGCATTGSVSAIKTVKSVATSDALVYPPPGGPAVVSVIQTQYTNGLEQHIALRTESGVPGQNVINVKFTGGGDQSTRTEQSLSSSLKNNNQIASEMQRSMPGVAMKQSPLFLQNNYGPFGYASGRASNGDTCLYGWQQIRASNDARQIFTNLGLIQLRLRLCDASRSEQALLSTMYGFTISGAFETFNWNPYGPAAGAGAAVGRVGNPIYPPIPYAEAPPTASRSAPARAKPRVVVSPAVSGPHTTAQPAVAGPRIPSPAFESPATFNVAAPRATPANAIVIPSPHQPTAGVP